MEVWCVDSDLGWEEFESLQEAIDFCVENGIDTDLISMEIAV